MKSALHVVLMLIASSVGAQHYEHTLKKCIKNFQEGLADFANDNASAEVERRYRVLDECMRGQKFPAFKLSTYEGEKYSSEQHANKVVVLNFWVTKSPTAVAAIPYLNELADEYMEKDFVILSFSTEEIEALTKFLKTKPVKYRVFGKSRDLINHQFQTLLGYPTTIILNKKGEVAKYKVGGA